MSVNFRGRPACACLAAWLPIYEAELQRRGLLDGALRIFQLIGGAAASGGTHATGGAFDILDLPGNDDVAIARQMGADATWLRKYNWDGKGGMAHVHGVLRGCPHNGPARYQIDAVDDGYNGLGRGGRGAKDDGPRPLSGRTWVQGIAWARTQAGTKAYRGIGNALRNLRAAYETAKRQGDVADKRRIGEQYRATKKIYRELRRR
jgi:hypothetical protein